VLELFRKLLVEEHRNTAVVYGNLAKSQQAQGKYVEAETGFRKALELSRKLLGEEHLDTAAAMPLEQEVLQRIDDGARRILIDCSRLEYVNSSGLKVFLIAAKRLDTLGGKIAFCALAPNVQMIFEMIGFDKILSIFATRAEALADAHTDRSPRLLRLSGAEREAAGQIGRLREEQAAHRS